ncbi:hypothetical protein DSECCO2_244530 [anaerobic digester metagenome]
MEDYAFLKLPKSCAVGNTIFKKHFYDNGDLTRADEKLLKTAVTKMTWLYTLKKETLNIQPYADEIRTYPEIEILEVRLEGVQKIERLAEIIMRAIPYPMLLIFRFEQQWAFWTAHQRNSLKDETKNTLEGFVHSNFLASDAALFKTLDFQTLAVSNCYQLYSQIVDAISIFNLAQALGETGPEIDGQTARALLGQLESLDQQLRTLRAELKKELQFNRKMALNMKIKGLEAEKEVLEDNYEL